MKVLHCAETIKGGITSYLRDLLPLQVQEFGPGQVGILAPEDQVGELNLPNGVIVYTFRKTNSRFFRAVLLVLGLLRILIKARPDILHLHSTIAGATLRPFIALVAGRRRIIYCPHGWAWDREMSSLAQRLAVVVERSLACLCNAVICISDYELRSALQHGIDEGKLVVVRNGLTDVRPTGVPVGVNWPPSSRRLLFVGRFDRQKGIDIFLDVLRRLEGFATGVVAGGFVVTADGGLNFPPNAQCIGWAGPRELETLFGEADVLIVPSRWEGFGLIAAEAMRAGLPVIASRVGGLAEVVAHGESGVLVESGDVEAILSAIRELDDEKLARMGSSGMVRFHREFTIDRVHRELCGVYERVGV